MLGPTGDPIWGRQSLQQNRVWVKHTKCMHGYEITRRDTETMKQSKNRLLRGAVFGTGLEGDLGFYGQRTEEDEKICIPEILK